MIIPNPAPEKSNQDLERDNVLDERDYFLRSSGYKTCGPGKCFEFDVSQPNVEEHTTSDMMAYLVTCAATCYNMPASPVLNEVLGDLYYSGSFQTKEKESRPCSEDAHS